MWLKCPKVYIYTQYNDEECPLQHCMCCVTLCAGERGLMWLFVRGHHVMQKVSCLQLAVLWLKCIVGHWCRHMSDCIPDTKSSTHTHHSCWDKNNVTYLSAANILKWADTLKHSPTQVKHRWPRTAAPKSAPFIKIQKWNRHRRQTRRINVVFGLSVLENTCSNTLIKPNFPLNQS